MTLRFATTNRDKLSEVSELLRRPLIGVGLELDELQSTELEQITRHKVKQAYKQVRSPVIVEDTALVFTAWGKLPGPFVKFFLAELGLTGLVDALEPFDNWEAEAICGVGYHDGERVHYFEGHVPGRIVPPFGTRGFGWDAIFCPIGATRTFGQMSPSEKHSCSMRGIAIRNLAKFLDAPSPQNIQRFAASPGEVLRKR